MFILFRELLELHPFWLGVFCCFIVSCGVLSLLYRWRLTNRKKPPLQPTPTPPPAPLQKFYQNNDGWVTPNVQWLIDMTQEPLPIQTLSYQNIPDAATAFIIFINKHEMFKVISEFKMFEGDFADDMRRGLSIGAALFSYSIPESFVLIDRKTKSYLVKYLADVKERRTYDLWFKDLEKYQMSYGLIGSVERELNITFRDILQFYTRNSIMLTDMALDYSELRWPPTMSAMSRVVLGRLNLPPNTTTYHYIAVSFCAIVRTAGVKIPFNWVMISTLCDQLYNQINGIETPSMGLSLVVNNQKQ